MANQLPFRGSGPRGNPAPIRLQHQPIARNAAEGPNTAAQPVYGDEKSSSTVNIRSELIALDNAAVVDNTTLKKDLAGFKLIGGVGNYVWIPFTTNVTDFIVIQLGSSNDPVIVQAGTSIVGVDFDKLLIWFPSTANAKACIAYGYAGKENLAFG